MTDLPEDTIIDLSQPGVIHYIYPTGREVNLMDPNIGGWLKPKNEEEDPEFDPSIQEEIWGGKQ